MVLLTEGGSPSPKVVLPHRRWFSLTEGGSPSQKSTTHGRWFSVTEKVQPHGRCRGQALARLFLNTREATIAAAATRTAPPIVSALKPLTVFMLSTRPVTMPPTTPPPTPNAISAISPYEPSFITRLVSQPAAAPSTIHMKRLMSLY